MVTKKLTITVFINENDQITLESSSEGFNLLELMGVKYFIDQAYNDMVEEASEDGMSDSDENEEKSEE